MHVRIDNILNIYIYIKYKYTYLSNTVPQAPRLSLTSLLSRSVSVAGSVCALACVWMWSESGPFLEVGGLRRVPHTLLLASLHKLVGHLGSFLVFLFPLNFERVEGLQKAKKRQPKGFKKLSKSIPKSPWKIRTMKLLAEG